MKLLVKYLHDEIGAAFENIVVVVALGTHRKNTQDELKTLASEYVYNNVKVVDHDCDAQNLVNVGKTTYGTDVYVNRYAVGRKVIVISGTVHHIMAGYGGGRKSIIPGIAGRQTIKMNHSMALDPNEKKSNVLIGSGKLIKNPINDDMEQAGRMANPVFGISICVEIPHQSIVLFSAVILIWHGKKAVCIYRNPTDFR